MKDILKQKFKDWDMETAFLFLLWSAFVVLLCLFTMFVIADKKVRCYYLGSAMSAAGMAYQIKADINWLADDTVFSSPDYKATMAVYDKLPYCNE